MFAYVMLELVDQADLHGVHVVDGWDYDDGDGPVAHLVTAEPLVPWPADTPLDRRPHHVLPTIVGRYKTMQRLSTGRAVYDYAYFDLTATLPTIGDDGATVDRPFG